ncbi:hypothetical protein C8R44DRAFT_732693 [Mycena epipterygia]|nr:hypothetical protein C8R44DRAFT_732693 [Mycena epipterygia]
MNFQVRHQHHNQLRTVSDCSTSVSKLPQTSFISSTVRAAHFLTVTIISTLRAPVLRVVLWVHQVLDTPPRSHPKLHEVQPPTVLAQFSSIFELLRVGTGTRFGNPPRTHPTRAATLDFYSIFGGPAVHLRTFVLRAALQFSMSPLNLLRIFQLATLTLVYGTQPWRNSTYFGHLGRGRARGLITCSMTRFDPRALTGFLAD